ncbi:MAG: DUF3592 domain-containing protein [Planctomycetota bacterium]
MTDLTNGEIALLLFGTLVAVTAPVQYLRIRSRRARRTASVLGTVVGTSYVERTSGFDDDGSVVPVARVAYEVAGRTFEVDSEFGSTLRRPVRGARLRVAYAPWNPKDAEVLPTEGQRSLEATALIGFGLLGVGMLVAFAWRRLG